MGDKQPNHDAVLAKVNEIVEPELGMPLEIEYVDSASFAEKSKLKMASGEKFDLIWAGYANDYHTAVSLGGIMDITDYLDNIKMSDGTVVKMSDAVEQYYLDAAKVDGRIYGIPNIQINSNPLSFVIRKSVAEECEIDTEGLQMAAQTISDATSLRAYLDKLTKEFEKAKKKRPDLFTFNPSYSIPQRFIYEEIVGAVGIKKSGSSSEVVSILESDEYKLGVDAIRDWYEKGYIRSDIASKGYTLPNTEEEKQFVFVPTTWKPGQEIADTKHFGEDVVYSWIESPYVARTNPLATMLTVGENSEHAEAAVKFIYMMNSNKALYNLLCWGIEGENYTKNADGTVTEIPDSGYNETGSNAWRYGNQFNSFVEEGQPVTVWDDMRDLNNSAQKSQAMGFVPNTDSIVTELANITNVRAEYKAKIEFGTAPREEYWDEFIQKLKVAGIDKVRDEIQKQYDEFLAK